MSTTEDSVSEISSNVCVAIDGDEAKTVHLTVGAGDTVTFNNRGPEVIQHRPLTYTAHQNVNNDDEIGWIDDKVARLVIITITCNTLISAQQ
jgi:hypothetical protein